MRCVGVEVDYALNDIRDLQHENFTCIITCNDRVLLCGKLSVEFDCSYCARQRASVSANEYKHIAIPSTTSKVTFHAFSLSKCIACVLQISEQ